MNLELTEEQEEAIDEIFEVFSSGDYYAQISGAAGTGKTTLALELIRRAKEDGYECYLTAPTNKAAKVLAEKSGSHAVTIHKLLHLVLENVEDKQELSKGSAIVFDDTKLILIVIDEASMMSEELMLVIDKTVELNTHVKVLFLGDPYQLNPINEELSRALTYEGYELTTIMRQAQENPIIQLAHEIRAAQQKDVNAKIDWYKFADQKNIIIHDKTKKFLGSYIEDFKSGLSAHLVSWRNVKVDYMNNYVRKQLYGGQSKQRFLVNEIVMMYAPVMELTGQKKTLLQNSELCEIKTINKQIRFVGKYEFDSYTILLSSLEQNRTVQVFVPVDPTEVKVALAEIAAKANVLTEKSQKQERSWIYVSEFFPLKNYFADMKVAHAMTSHKSQGSTFHSVYVNVSDIMLNRNKMEMLRSLYVAVTRGAIKLHLYGCRR